MGLAGGFVGTVLGSLSTQGQKAYALAGGVATEVLSNIRTVTAFSGEEREIERYAKNLKDARKIGIKKGILVGLGMGLTNMLFFGSYALALYYGAILVVDEVFLSRYMNLTIQIELHRWKSDRCNAVCYYRCIFYWTSHAIHRMYWKSARSCI